MTQNHSTPAPGSPDRTGLLRGKAYAGDGVTVYYDPSLCIHVANCVRGLPEVFRPGERPWIQAGNAGAEEVAAVVRTCPTGALHYALEGGEGEAPAQPTRVIPVTDGPLSIRGDLLIETPTGEVREVRAALCRCGASGNQPFCDGTHAKIGWKSGGELPSDERGDDRHGEGQRADGAGK